MNSALSGICRLLRRFSCQLGLVGLLGLILVHSPGLRAAEPAKADAGRPLLSPIFGDNMVLQRGKPNRFWGWTEPGSKVAVSVGGRSGMATAGSDGKWSVTTEVPPAGGPYVVEISGAHRVTLRNVLVGDVWICGGQSNMSFALQESARGPEDARLATDAKLRLYTVATRSAYHPAAVPRGEWKESNPVVTAAFSAVGYYFATRIRRDVDVPIGLIQNSVGGSPAESWLSLETAGALGDFERQVAEIRRLDRKDGPRYGSFLMHWLDEFDAGSRTAPWSGPSLDESGWQPVRVPGSFAELGMADRTGVCWVRREIELPSGAAGPGKIVLGEIDKMDTTWINGRWIGASSWVENPRSYAIPAGVLQAGRNVIAVRVFLAKRDGGFHSPPDTLQLRLADGTSVPLAGNWKGKVGVDSTVRLPLDLENYPTMPTVLFNGMLAPVAPLAIAGVIWYQGEANTARAAQYRKLLPALISDWRAVFGQGEIPFYMVSLPGFMARRDQPGADGWTRVREAQLRADGTIPNAGAVITIDTGEADNIHPREKRAVGERLALLALARHYGRDIVYRGPTHRSTAREGTSIRIAFDHCDGGLVAHGDRVEEFSLAGPDRRWHWASARIERDAIVVSSPEVPDPVAVRYAWQANPRATLFNGAGLPAAPFRTDDWDDEEHE